MSPSPERQLPRRDRPQLQPRSAARIQQHVPSPYTLDAAAATAEPPPPWAHAWRALHTSHLDRSQRVTAWRLLHGKLFVGAFLRRIHRSDAAGHRCPHPACFDHVATLTHVLITCPLAAAVWDWFAATWAAITGGRAASKHRPSPGGRPADMEASYPAQAPLAQPTSERATSRTQRSLRTQ